MLLVSQNQIKPESISLAVAGLIIRSPSLSDTKGEQTQHLMNRLLCGRLEESYKGSSPMLLSDPSGILQRQKKASGELAI